MFGLVMGQQLYTDLFVVKNASFKRSFCNCARARIPFFNVDNLMRSEFWLVDRNEETMIKSKFKKNAESKCNAMTDQPIVSCYIECTFP